MPPLFSLPSDYATTTLGGASAVMTPLFPFIELIVGILIAVIATTFLVRVLTHH